MLIGSSHGVIRFESSVSGAMLHVLEYGVLEIVSIVSANKICCYKD